MLSGLFGTMVSIVFLEGVISVGASASVFGLVGACWADVILNFCARCTLKDSGVLSLFVATAFNLCVGLTPWVRASPRIAVPFRWPGTVLESATAPCRWIISCTLVGS